MSMLLTRIMPALLIKGDELVKTIRFKKPTYVGDPVNVISIFSELECDEIILLDIDATRRGRGPNFALLERVANESLVPMAYGGGITSLDEMQRIFRTGFEKVIVNSAAGEDPQLIHRAADQFGSQAVIVSIDVKRRLWGGNGVFIRCGTRSLGDDPVRHAVRIAELGAGEILLTSIDREGTMQGFDLELVRSVAGAVDVPVIAHAGAGKLSDLARPILEAGAAAAAAGSLFVFQGPARGVLINFPSRTRIDELMQASRAV